MSKAQPSIVSDYAPSIAEVSKTHFGDIAIYYLHDPNCDICKIEWVFETGTSKQDLSLQASFATNLLLEGTKDYNSKQFAQKLDELGAYFGVECGKDYTSFTLHVLNYNLKEALELIHPIFVEPTLDKIEFDKLLIESRQEFEHNLHNAGFLARQKLRQNLYLDHPYGKLAELTSYEQIKHSDIISYVSKNILGKQYKLFLSGDASDKVLSTLEKIVSSHNQLSAYAKENQFKINSKLGLTKITHKPAKQDSIRMGFNIPDQSHHDFLKLNLLNTILGGYFGARLMQNIREEKGWTYGINSSISPGKHACSLLIATDVLSGKGEACMEEIKNEFEKLQNDLISPRELNNVISYVRGNLLRSFDGVFQQMDRFQSTHLFGLDTQHYLDYLELLNSITRGSIQDTAKKHLISDSITKVLVSN